jgi:hypothetical protein
MKIKNIFFVMLACVISFSKPVFSSTAESTLNTLRSLDWDGLPDASEECQELWQQALAAVGVRDCEIPLKQGIPILHCFSLWDGKFHFGINEKFVKKHVPGEAKLFFYKAAMQVKHGAISVSINMPVALAEKILSMQETLGALYYLLRDEKNNVVDAWIKRVIDLIITKTQAALVSESPTNEELLTYSFKFILAYREGKNPDYNVFAKRYMTELLTGNKPLRCIWIFKKDRPSRSYDITCIDLANGDFVVDNSQPGQSGEPLRGVSIYQKNEISGGYEITSINFEDDDFIVDYSQSGQPIEPPAGMTVDEIADELSQKIFGS